MPNTGFRADSMLMNSWVADIDKNITFMSASLKKNLGELGHNFKMVGEIYKIKDGTNEDNLTITKLFKRISNINKVLQDRIFIHLDNLKDENFEQKYSEDVGDCKIIFEPAIQVTGHNEVSKIHLWGIKVMHNDGFQLKQQDGKSAGDDKRVDIIIVAQINEGKIEGFQGQLQDSWPRLQAIYKSATKSASMKLIGRSLSHNIGSHALYHINQSEKNETEKYTGEQRSLFAAYLQNRMELVNALAMEMPLSPMPVNLESALNNFNKNEMLLKNLCKTEGVETIKIDLHANQTKTKEVVIPGGILGLHCLYIIIENIARDAAKHERPDLKKYIEVKVDAKKSNKILDYSTQKSKDFYMDKYLEISDEAGKVKDTIKILESNENTITLEKEFNFENDWKARVFENMPLKISVITKELENYIEVSIGCPMKGEKSDVDAYIFERFNEICNDGRIADAMGNIRGMNYGVLERLVCASILRGFRPDELLPGLTGREGYPEQDEKKYYLGMTLPHSEKQLPLLSVSKQGDLDQKMTKVQWSFYLKKRVDTVFIVNQDQKKEGFNFKNIKEINKNIEKNTQIQGEACVIDEELEPENVKKLFKFRFNLPHLTYNLKPIASPPETVNSFFYPTQEINLIEDIYKCEVQRLTEKYDLKLDESNLKFENAPIVIKRHPNHDYTNRINNLKCHCDCSKDRILNYYQDGNRHYDYFEGYNGGDDLDFQWNNVDKIRLLQAALTRILVVDERLGEVGSNMDKEVNGITPREKWALRGVDILKLYQDDIYSSVQIDIEKVCRREKYNFVLVHYGVLEKTKNIKALLEILNGSDKKRGLCETLIIHSGRSKPVFQENMQNFKFTPFSNVEHFINSKTVSKYSLVEFLLNL